MTLRIGGWAWFDPCGQRCVGGVCADGGFDFFLTHLYIFTSNLIMPNKSMLTLTLLYKSMSDG